MLVVNSKEEFEEHYPYSKDQIREYPQEYPCVMGIFWEGGGLMGDYKQVYVAYFPKNMSSNDAFLYGMSQPWKMLK
jgi:hypothetical protein